MPRSACKKIAQLLLNIVTFCHGAALQTNHRASCGHVRHGAPRWLYFDCAMQMINKKVRYLSTWRDKFTSQATLGSSLNRMLSGWKLLKSRCSQEARRNLSTSKPKRTYFRGIIALEATMWWIYHWRKAAPYKINWRHRVASVRIFETAVPQEPNWKIWA
jgi:hypothetical protein